MALRRRADAQKPAPARRSGQAFRPMTAKNGGG
jgi:hypothetical protein